MLIMTDFLFQSCNRTEKESGALKTSFPAGAEISRNIVATPFGANQSEQHTISIKKGQEGASSGSNLDRKHSEGFSFSLLPVEVGELQAATQWLQPQQVGPNHWTSRRRSEKPSLGVVGGVGSF